MKQNIFLLCKVLWDKQKMEKILRGNNVKIICNMEYKIRFVKS